MIEFSSFKQKESGCSAGGQRQATEPSPGYLSANANGWSWNRRKSNLTERDQDLPKQNGTEVALRQSEEFLRLLLDSTGVGSYGVALERNYTFCNPACFRILGYGSSDELLGKFMHNFIHHGTPDGKAHPPEECRIYRALRKQEGVHADHEFLWRRDRTCLPTQDWSYPVLRNGGIKGASVSFLISQSVSKHWKIRIDASSNALSDP